MNVTIPFVLLIIAVFGYFVYQAWKMRSIYTKLETINQQENTLESLDDTPFADLKTNYAKSLNIETDEGMKTNIPSTEFFSTFNVCKTHRLNLRMLDTASGTLVGLGLLGTFLGLTLGINGFESGTTDDIKNSIQTLLNGMGTAFMTSLVGMGLSLIYTFFDKRWRNHLAKHLLNLTEKLDDAYYMDDVTLVNLKQEKLFTKLQKHIEEVITSQLTYQNENGETATAGNAIREILKENSEQSAALKSFSTDLAIELNNGFDEVMSRQMQEKILPLMENVDTTTKAIVEHIDSMASLVSSPATDIIENMVSELKASMSEIIAEFNKNLSGSATDELENLAKQLSTAGEAMTDFPKTMDTISATLQITIEEVKNAVAEISNTSANANSQAMQQMQEQITFATGAISNAIAEVKTVMEGMSDSSQEQSKQMVSKMADAAEKMGQFLNNTVANLSTSVQSSVKEMTDDMSSKQANLIALQENTSGETRKLLESFNTGLDRLEKMNEYITGTMDMFQKAQGQITGSTAHLQSITGDMKLATELFNKSQTDFNQQVELGFSRNMDRMNEATQLMNKAGEMSNDYVEKFNVIKEGIGQIFSSIQLGLNEYSKTVQATTQKYLEQYSTSLTSTTDALSSTIQQQNEVVEMMVEALNKNNK